MLKKRERIINKIKARMRKPERMKFGVKVTLTVEKAFDLHKKTEIKYGMTPLKKIRIIHVLILRF